MYERDQKLLIGNLYDRAKVMKQDDIQKPSVIEKLILNKLGIFIATQRKLKGITQKELNTLSHVSLAVIADLENGKSMPRVETLIRLGVALGIEIDDIFETMKCETNNIICEQGSDPTKNSIKDEKAFYANLASTIAGFGYKKDMVNEIMDYISFVEYKYEKKKLRH